MIRPVYFINLTAGLYFFEHGALTTQDTIRFCHLQSSHLENQNYNRFLYSIPDEMLLNLALGKNCILCDATSGKQPKTIKVGVPLIKFILNKRWFGKEIFDPPIGKKEYLRMYSTIEGWVKRKLDYYKKYLVTDKLRLEGIFLRVYKENTQKLIDNFKERCYVKRKND